MPPEIDWDSNVYGEVISSAAALCSGRFAALASPTFSKQEAVTFLAESIKAGIGQGRGTPRFPWRRVVEFVPRLIVMFARVSYAAIRFRTRRLPEGTVYFRTWLVPSSFSRETLADDYFRQLPEDIARTDDVVVGFTAIDIGLMHQFARSRKNQRHILGYGLLSLIDVITLFWDYVSTGLVQVRHRLDLKGVDVSGYVNRSLLLDYLELRSFEAYAEKHKCRKLIGHRIRAFVYTFENQSWEKVCCATLRGHDIKLIGYQSSGLSPLHLNFFPNEQDSRSDPMPDIVLTVGDLFRRYLLDHGRYRIPVRAFAALRFPYPHNGRVYTTLEPHRAILGRILYALPINLQQYRSILNDLLEAFGDSDIAVDVKFHPVYRPGDITGMPQLPGTFRIVTEVAMDTLRDTYDCVLFNDNSFGIEALFQGVKCHQYSRNGNHADDRLIYFDLWKARYSFVDLCRLKEELAARSYDKSFDWDAVSRYVNGMYRPYAGDSLGEFQALLNAQVVPAEPVAARA